MGDDVYRVKPRVEIDCGTRSPDHQRERERDLNISTVVQREIFTVDLIFREKVVTCYVCIEVFMRLAS